MSEPTEQQAKDNARRAEIEAKINAKIKEFSQYEDTWFIKSDGSGLPTHVIRYDGIKVGFDGQATYTFLVEQTGHGRWTPGAAKFLEEHKKIEAPKTANLSEPI